MATPVETPKDNQKKMAWNEKGISGNMLHSKYIIQCVWWYQTQEVKNTSNLTCITAFKHCARDGFNRLLVSALVGRAPARSLTSLEALQTSAQYTGNTVCNIMLFHEHWVCLKCGRVPCNSSNGYVNCDVPYNSFRIKSGRLMLKKKIKIKKSFQMHTCSGEVSRKPTNATQLLLLG